MSSGASLPTNAARPSPASSPDHTLKHWLRSGATVALLVVGLLILTAWLGLRTLSAVPDITPAGASPMVFSAERAMTHVKALSIAPRPIGSPANTAARDYITAYITELGLEPVVQSTQVLRHEPGFPEAHLVSVHNILARVPGTQPGSPALLVSGHYDSVPSSVGASDCGMCAATTLEALRAVVAAVEAGQPLRNDVIFLLSDAEELGVAGATGFMRDHPWAADVGLSVVFEGLGSDGAPLLYISRPDSGAVVAEALDALERDTRYSQASSFLHDFMWTVAGNTGSDLDAFGDGAPGLAFLYLSLETVAAYHSTADSVAGLDPRSVQGMGDFALAMTRHFGNKPLDELSNTPDLVMFPIAPGVVARYSSVWALPLAMVAVILFLAALIVEQRRGGLSFKRILAVFATSILTILTAVLAATLAWWLVRFMTPTLHQFTVGGWWGASFYLSAVLALALLVVVAWRALLRRFAAADYLAGWLGLWVFLAVLTAIALPGVSYLFAWPLLIVAGGWLLTTLPGRGRWRVIPPVAAAVVAVLLFVPVAIWLWIYVGRAEAMMGLPMAGLPVLFVTPALALLLASIEIIARRRQPKVPVSARGWRLVGASLLALTLALFILPALAGPSENRPLANTIVYTLEGNPGEAHWLTFNDSRAGRGTRHQLDEWTSQFFAAGIDETVFDPWLLTRSDTPYPALRSPAPTVALPRTALSLSEASPDSTRLVAIRPAEAWLTRFLVRSATPLTGITFDGRSLDLGGQQPGEYTFLVFGDEREVVIELDGADSGEVTVTTLDRLIVDIEAVAAQAGLQITPRPAWMATAAAGDTADGALVTSYWQW